MPIILACEFLFWVFGVLSQRSLYGEDGKKIPWRVVIRAGCSAYAFMGLLPMGRLVAESSRAVIFAPYVGRSRAASVAVQVQIVALFVTSAVGTLCALAFAWVLGAGIVTLLAFLNALLVLTVGVLALLAAKHFRLGKRLARFLPRIQVFGEQFDAYLLNCRILMPKALMYEGFCRTSQVVQNGFLVLAVGGSLGILPAFCSEGLHLIGATLGDFVPGQLGVTELVFKEASAALALNTEQALSIALLAHASQLFWILVALGALHSPVLRATHSQNLST